MKLETLEKLLAYIDLVKYGPFAPRAKARDELRALVKAESEPTPQQYYVPPEVLAHQTKLAEELQKLSKGGDAHMPSRPLDGKLNPPSEVRAEGRGEICYVHGCGSSAFWNIGGPKDPKWICVSCHAALLDAVGHRHDSNGTIRVPNITSSKPHNPDNLPSAGEGYRFLDEDEIVPEEDYPVLPEIEWFSGVEWIPNWKGSTRSARYRTRLTREQLAQKRKEGK